MQSAATCSRWFLARGFSTLKMEAILSSETSVHTRSTQRHITEDGILQTRLCLPPAFKLVSCLAYSFTLKMEVTYPRRQNSSKPCVNTSHPTYETSRCETMTLLVWINFKFGNINERKECAHLAAVKTNYFLVSCLLDCDAV
jgi:hypothetical protein